MVSSVILECGRPLEVLNNYKIGSGVEVNPERRNFDFTKKFIWYWEANIYKGIMARSRFNLTIFMEKLSTSNEIHNMRNIIWN